MPEILARRPPTVLACALLLTSWCLGCDSPPPEEREVHPPEVVPSEPPSASDSQDSTLPEIRERPIGAIAAALNRELGFVSMGTFVIEREPNQVRNGKKTRTIKAYLPVGTPVFLSNCDIPINEGASRLKTSVTNFASSSRVYPYCDIVTSLGIDGLVREGQVTRFEGNGVAVAIADTPIEVLSPTSDQPAGSFSRTSGVYVEVIGDSTQHYDVRMPWSAPANMQGRLLKGSQEGRMYVHLDATAQFAEPVEFRSFTGEVYQQLQRVSGAPVSYLVKQLSRGLDSVASDLNSLTNLQCITTVNVEAQAGVKIFGTGLGIQTTTNLFESGFKYEVGMDLLFANNQFLRTLITMKKLRCETILAPHPVEMTAFGLFGDRRPTDGNSFIFLNSNPETTDLLAVPDEGVSPPMFRIRDWYEYDRRTADLQRSMTNNKWFSSLRPAERDVLLHYILEQVALFSPEG